MKKILFIFLIYLYITQDDEILTGPAYNYKHKQSTRSCADYFVYYDGKWLDELYTEENVPQGVSDCVDTLLWDNYDKRYYDRCCYIRLQHEGKMHSGCFSLNEEGYLDISEAIRQIEEGAPSAWTFDGPKNKIYQMDCHSTFIKILIGASILLALIF